ncbi:MAG: site-specific integrase, partial [Cyanobacteria bacterium REEB65]|nr:site-specific integrase [Cyanobacteria bacterium REEB65]
MWYANLGEVSPRTGRPKPVILCDEDGQPIRRDDEAGKDRAIARIIGKRADPTGPTVAEVIRAYLAWHEREGSALRTRQDHWFHLRRFAHWEYGGVRYAMRPAAEILPDDLWRIKQSGKGAIRQLYMSVLACWNWAASPIEGRTPRVMIPANALAGVKRPRRGPPSGATSWPDARRLLRLARGWARQPSRTRRKRTRWSRWLLVQSLALIAYSGPRTAEAITLEWGDIHWSEGVAVIPRTRHKTGRRTQRDRYFPIGPHMARILELIRRHPDRHPRWVFATRWTERANVKEFWRRLRVDLKPYLGAHGMELPEEWGPYWLRHGYATVAVEAVGLDLTSKTMGNSPQVVREVYDHTTLGRVRGVDEAVRQKRRTTPDAESGRSVDPGPSTRGRRDD